MDVTEQFEDRNSFLHWFLIASLSGVEIQGAVSAVPRILTMQLNGVELNPEVAIKRMEEQLAQLVEQNARELLEESMRDLLIPWEEMVEDTINAVKTIMASKRGGISTKSWTKRGIQRPYQ